MWHGCSLNHNNNLSSQLVFCDNADWLVEMVSDNRDDSFKIAEDEKCFDKRINWITSMGVLSIRWITRDDSVLGEKTINYDFYCLGSLSCNLIFNLLRRHDTSKRFWIFSVGLGKAKPAEGLSIRLASFGMEFLEVAMRWKLPTTRGSYWLYITFQCRWRIWIKASLTMITVETKGLRKINFPQPKRSCACCHY